MSELFELIIEGEGEVRDADGNLLNQPEDTEENSQEEA